MEKRCPFCHQMAVTNADPSDPEIGYLDLHSSPDRPICIGAGCVVTIDTTPHKQETPKMKLEIESAIKDAIDRDDYNTLEDLMQRVDDEKILICEDLYAEADEYLVTSASFDKQFTKLLSRQAFC